MLEEDKHRTYHVAFASDATYARHIPPIIRSIQRFDPHCNWEFHVLHADMPMIEKRRILRTNAKVNFIQISPDEFGDMSIPATCAHLTVQTYYRFSLPTLLPNISQVLYLDCDVSILRSIASLYALDLSDFLAAAVPDGDIETQHNALAALGMPQRGTYFNAGVMLINLERWRRDSIQSKLFSNQIRLEGQCQYADQDVINYTLHGKIYRLDNDYNFLATSHKGKFNKPSLHKPTIIHYNGKNKPWNPANKHPFSNFYISTLNYKEFARFFALRLLASLVYFRKDINSITIKAFGFSMLKIRKRQNIGNMKASHQIKLVGIKLNARSKK